MRSWLVTPYATMVAQMCPCIKTCSRILIAFMCEETSWKWADSSDAILRCQNSVTDWRQSWKKSSDEEGQASKHIPSFSGPKLKSFDTNHCTTMSSTPMCITGKTGHHAGMRKYPMKQIKI